MKFGTKIRHLLELRGMTQLELAEKSGVSHTVIKALANDRQTSASTDTIEKIAKALGIPMKYFFDDNIVTPFEVMDVPEHIKRFVLSKQNIDYLKLAIEIKEGFRLPPEVAREVIKNFETIIKMHNDKKNSQK